MMLLDDFSLGLLIVAIIFVVISFGVKLYNINRYIKFKKKGIQIHGELYAFSTNKTHFIDGKETLFSIKDGMILIQQDEVILQVPLMSIYGIEVTAFSTYAYVYLKKDDGNYPTHMERRYGRQSVITRSRGGYVIREIRGVKPFQKDITADLCFIEFNYPGYQKVIYGLLADENADLFKRAYKLCLSNNEKYKKDHPPYENWKDDVKINVGSYFSQYQKQEFYNSKYQDKGEPKIITQRVEYNTANNTTVITTGGNDLYTLLYLNKNQKRKLEDILAKVIEYDEDAINNNSNIENKIVGLLEFNQYIFGLISTRLIENIEIPISFSCSYYSKNCYSKIEIHIKEIPTPLNIRGESTLLDIENVKKLLNLISDETINNILENRKNDKH